MKAFSIPKEYFFKEYHDFRKVMGTKGISVEDKLEAFKGFFYVYLNLNVNLPEKDKEICISAMDALNVEVNMRLGLQSIQEIMDNLKEELEK